MVTEMVHDPPAASTRKVSGAAKQCEPCDLAAMASYLADLRAALTAYYAKVWGECGADDEAFAKRMGYSVSLIQQLRRGGKNVTVEHIAQLAAIQGVPVVSVLADIASILGRKMSTQQSVDAPGSTEGSAVTARVAERMPRGGGGTSGPSGASGPSRGRRPK
jgi:transcriptional regulator with XRE-family HTH domain